MPARPSLAPAAAALAVPVRDPARPQPEPGARRDPPLALPLRVVALLGAPVERPAPAAGQVRVARLAAQSGVPRPAQEVRRLY